MNASLLSLGRALVAYVVLPAVGLLLGWSLWRLLHQGQANLSPGKALAVGLVAWGWLAVVLAAANALHFWLMAILVAALALAAFWLPAARRGRLAWERTRLGSGGWAAVLLLLVAGWLLARPAETFLVTDDAAVYTLGAVHLAETGALTYDAPGVLPLEPGRPDLPLSSHTTAYWDYLQDYARQFLLPENVGAPAGTRFWGPFFQPVLYRSSVEIGFLPLPKAAGALMGWLLGVQEVIWAGPAMALLGLVALLALGRRAGGWGLAVPATALLALSLPQVWFGRQLLSEPLAQALVLGALWLDGEARDAREPHVHRTLQSAQAAALGLLPLARLEGALIAVVLLVGLTWSRPPADTAADRRLWLQAALMVALGQTLALLTSTAYLYSRLIGLLGSDRRPLLVWAIVLFLALAMAAWRCRGAARVRRWRHWLQCWTTRQTLASAIGILYLLVIVVTIMWGPKANLYTHWLAQYWTRPGLLLGALGMVLAPWVLPTTQRGLRALLIGGACFGLLFAINPMVSWAHPWVMRRAVVTLLPALAVGEVVAVGALATWATRLLGGTRWARAATWAPRSAWAASALVLAGLCFGVAQRMLPIVQHHERQGMWAQIAQVDALLTPNSLVLLDDGQIGRQLGQALALAHGHQVYNIQQTETLAADSALVEQLIAAGRSQNRAVYWLVSDTDRRFAPVPYDLVSVGGVPFDTPTLQMNSDGPPSAAQLVHQAFLVDVYALLPKQPPSALPTTVDIPLGVGSYPYLMDGFFSLEHDPAAGPFRWTSDEAILALAWPAESPDAPADFELAVTIASWRPPGGKEVQMGLWAEGEPLLVTATSADGTLVELRATAVDLANIGDPALEIVITSDTFTPRDYGVGDDTRTLGVKVYAIQLTPLLGDD